MWQLPDSCSSASDDGPEDVPDRGPPLHRGRGRPVGGSLRLQQVQQAVLARHGVVAAAPTAVPPCEQSRQKHQQQQQHHVDLLSSRLQACPDLPGVGGMLVQAAMASDRLPAPEIEPLLQEMLGEAPRHLMGSQAHADSIGMPRTTCHSHTQDLAAACHFGSRSWTSAVVTQIHSRIRGGALKPLAAIVYTLYDETPLPLRSLLNEEDHMDALFGGGPGP